MSFIARRQGSGNTGRHVTRVGTVVAVAIGLLGCQASADADRTVTSTTWTTIATSSTPTTQTSPPASDTTASDPATGDAGVIPDETMFTTVAATVVDADGETCELCVWLADNDVERARGLMEATSLGGRDAMAFVYSAPHQTRFWMKNMEMSLSIAFFDVDGLFIESIDLEPCADDDVCPLYPTPPDFTVALEVPTGGLADVGVKPGSVITVTDLPCAASGTGRDV